MYSNLHARPYFQIEAPKLVTHLAFRTDELDNRDELYAFNSEVCRYFPGLPFPSQPANRQFTDYGCYDEQNISIRDGEQVVIQNHTNFITYTFVSDANKESVIEWNAIPKHIKASNFANPVPLIAVHIRIEKFDSNKNICYNLKETFGFDDIYRDLLGSHVSDRGALVWTPFREYADGYSRILIRNINLNAARLGRLVRRMLEIETYMRLALSRVSKAREELLLFKTNQEALTKYLDHNRAVPIIYNFVLYFNLASLAKDISDRISSKQSGFNESIAYSNLVWQRVDELREERLEGWARIRSFLERRFRPSIETCQSAIRCQIQLSQNVANATELVRSGMDFVIAAMLILLTIGGIILP